MSMFAQKLARPVAASEAAFPAPMRASQSRLGTILDLVHLARLSRGDRALEMQLLGQFDRQAVVAGARLRAAADSEAGFSVLRILAATARIVGAFAVAAACDGYLAALKDGLPARDRLQALDAVEGEINIARAAIYALLPQEGR